MRTGRLRSGFTVVELMAALGISLLVLTVAGAMVRNMAEARWQLRQVTTREARHAVGEELLVELARGAVAPPEQEPAVTDFRAAVDLVSWCRGGRSVRSRCLINLSLRSRGDSTFVVASGLGSGPLELWVRDGRWEWRYLDPDERPLRWTAQPPRTGALPRALALVREGDTVVFPIGSGR